VHSNKKQIWFTFKGNKDGFELVQTATPTSTTTFVSPTEETLQNEYLICDLLNLDYIRSLESNDASFCTCPGKALLKFKYYGPDVAYEKTNLSFIKRLKTDKCVKNDPTGFNPSTMGICELIRRANWQHFLGYHVNNMLLSIYLLFSITFSLTHMQLYLFQKGVVFHRTREVKNHVFDSSVFESSVLSSRKKPRIRRGSCVFHALLTPDWGDNSQNSVVIFPLIFRFSALL
jgi:hypothetical protein